MKCELCGREITGRDYIHLKGADQKDIYVHPMPCEYYESEGDMDNSA